MIYASGSVNLTMDSGLVNLTMDTVESMVSTSQGTACAPNYNTHDFAEHLEACALRNSLRIKGTGVCMQHLQHVSYACGQCMGRLMDCGKQCISKCCSGNCLHGDNCKQCNNEKGCNAAFFPVCGGGRSSLRIRAVWNSCARCTALFRCGHTTGKPAEAQMFLLPAEGRSWEAETSRTSSVGRKADSAVHDVQLCFAVATPRVNLLKRRCFFCRPKQSSV